MPWLLKARVKKPPEHAHVRRMGNTILGEHVVDRSRPVLGTSTFADVIQVCPKGRALRRIVQAAHHRVDPGVSLGAHRNLIPCWKNAEEVLGAIALDAASIANGVQALWRVRAK